MTTPRSADRCSLVALVLCLAICGCGPEPTVTVPPESAAPDAAATNPAVDTPPTNAAPAPGGAGAAPTNARADKSNVLRREKRQREILKILGAIDSWHVSLEKGGKTDEGLVKLNDSGAIEKVLKDSFTHRGLELKFFTHLPPAIEKLRDLRPRPDRCDFKVAVPVSFDEMKKNLPKDIIGTDEVDPSGVKLTWYKDSEVSFGVVDNKVTVVRVHLNTREYDWQTMRSVSR